MSPRDVSPVHRTRFVRVVVSESRRGMGMPFAYSPEFRSMVVEQMRDGRSVAGVARELEMHESMLRSWTRSRTMAMRHSALLAWRLIVRYLRENH